VDWPEGGGAAFLIRGLQEDDRKAILDATCTLAHDAEGNPYLQRDELAYAQKIAATVVSDWRGVSINGKSKFSPALLEQAMQAREVRNFVIAQARKLGAVVDDEETAAKED
jgi:hypothetical protein